jgi:hypothetical protein
MEPMTQQVHDLLSEDINKICTIDPRVTPTQINLIEAPGGYLIEITLMLTGSDQSTTIRLSFDQQTGLTVQ